MRQAHLSLIFTLFQFSTALIRSPIYRFKTSSKPLFESYRDEENKGLSLKVVGTLAILTLGVFGTGFLGSAQSFLRELGNPNTVQTTENKLKGSKIENRGALTRLTKREMNEKLQNIPVFFVSADDGKSVYTVDGVGSFFEDLADATRFAATNNAKLTVSATSLNDVYFTLLDRQTKLGKFITGVAQESDAAATYVLRANDKEYSGTSDKYRESHTINDYPLYRVPNLVFPKEDGLEVPLFLRREDAATSFDRLQEAKKTAASTPTGRVQEEALQVQEVSLLDIMKLFQTGGFESRALEFYPSNDSITQARRLMGLPLE